MKNRQHAAVPRRIEKLVAVPTGCQWARFRLAIADDAGYDQVRVIERGSVSMAERVAEFATFVDRAWCFWGNVRGDAAGEAELLEQLSHPLGILADIRVDLAVSSFQVSMGNQGRTAVTRTDDVNHAQVIALDDPIQVHVEHVQAG